MAMVATMSCHFGKSPSVCGRAVEWSQIGHDAREGRVTVEKELGSHESRDEDEVERRSRTPFEQRILDYITFPKAGIVKE